jgi:eukaryotic-like serine/threonine-protein kinase
MIKAPMMVPPNLPHLLEVSFEVLSTAAGIFVILLALRTAPTLTLFAHRLAMQIFVFAAIVVVLSESAGLVASLLRSRSTFADVAEDFAELLALASVGLALHLMNRAEREEVSALRRSANVDELTNLSSRSFFRRAAARRIELSIKNDLPLACLMIDIDDFKLYNDRYGHGAGDEALRCVARVLSEASRADDQITRYGGEEFVLLMSSELEDAREAAERIRERVERECSPEYDPSLGRTITVSVGVAPLTESVKTLDQLIRTADVEMYRAKQAGKNRVSIASTVPPGGI